VIHRESTTALMVLVLLGVLGGVIPVPAILVLVPAIYAFEHGRKKRAIAKVVDEYGSLDAAHQAVATKTEALHELYRKHNVPQEDWKH
jgi:hypothetical protein